eukprot:549484-Hanusia_phi.AAC.1
MIQASLANYERLREEVEGRRQQRGRGGEEERKRAGDEPDDGELLGIPIGGWSAGEVREGNGWQDLAHFGDEPEA